jgi:hypothetical protein
MCQVKVYNTSLNSIWVGGATQKKHKEDKLKKTLVSFCVECFANVLWLGHVYKKNTKPFYFFINFLFVLIDIKSYECTN